MARFALLLALLGSACQADFVAEPLDAGCEVPGPPYIDNLVLNSKLEPESEGWCMCVKMQWIDPGESANTTAPNMFGGYMSAELRGYHVDSVWFDEDVVDPTATSGSFSARFGPLEGAAEDSIIEFEIRARDRCGQVSNEKHGAYVLGSGKVVEEYDGEGMGAGDGSGCESYSCIPDTAAP